jgi:SAM-dependent methyltransferase
VNTDPADESAASPLDVATPHSARVWNYWLGGKDNYPADREYGDQVNEVHPGIVDLARAARGFLGRAVGYLAGGRGIRQFLDIGTGLPTADNTHEVAQRIAPGSRVVYTDNDPLVLVYARSLLTSAPEGKTAYLDADVRDPEKILTGAATTLDFSQPIALVLSGVMGTIPDNDSAYAIVAQLLDALAPGSYLVASDGTNTFQEADTVNKLSGDVGFGYHLRSPEEIARFFDGLELVEPGVVSVSQWRPAPDPAGMPARVHQFGGVGRKP